MSWQNTLAGTPATTETAAYDGEGHRVASTTSSNGAVISTTDYLAGGLEEVTTSGSTTTLTKYEAVPGVCNVVIVGSGPSETISYVATDGLGSVSEALDGNGNVTAQQLYGPYGTGRFVLGSMPTSKGFTGQYGDPATTGRDYYGARYYDPLVGQFTSADTAGDGLNRYAYVHDDPETATDPTGHFRCDDSGCQRKGGGNGGAGGCTFDCKGSPSGGCKSDCGGKPPSGPTGGNGTGGDSGDPCANPQSSACRAIKEAAWEKNQQSRREDKLAGERILAGVLLLAGSLIDIIADVIGIIKSHSASLILEDIIDIASQFVSALSFIPLITGDKGQFAGLYAVASGFHFLASIARNALAALHQWGAIAEGAADVAATAVTSGLEGVPGALLQVVTTIATPYVNNLITAGGHVLQSMGYAALSDYERQDSEGITAWCAANAGTCQSKASYGL